MNDITNTILKNPIFAGLSQEDAEALARYCEVLVLPPNHRIFVQGEVSKSMFVLFRGQLVIKVRDIQGTEKEVGIIPEGDLFGEMGVLENEVRSASVYTVSASIVLRIPGRDFYTMIEEGHPAVHILLKSTIDEACVRLRELDQRLDDLFRK